MPAETAGAAGEALRNGLCEQSGTLGAPAGGYGTDGDAPAPDYSTPGTAGRGDLALVRLGRPVQRGAANGSPAQAPGHERKAGTFNVSGHGARPAPFARSGGAQVGAAGNIHKHGRTRRSVTAPIVQPG